MPHHYHAADRLRPAFVKRTPAQGWSHCHRSDIFNAHRDIVHFPHDGAFNILDTLNQTQTANHILGPVYFDCSGTDIDIRHLHGIVQVAQSDPVRLKSIRVGIDLVLLHESAYRRHLGHAIGRGQSISHRPVLNRTQFMKVPSPGYVAVGVPALQRVPEDLPQGGSVRSQRGLHTFGKASPGQRIEFFHQARARPVEVYVILENHIDGGEAKIGKAPYRPHPRRSQQRHRERIRDLVLDILGRPTHPLGKDYLLVLADIGDSIHRHRIARQSAEIPVKRRDHDAPGNERHQYEPDNELVVQAVANGDVKERTPVFCRLWHFSCLSHR